MKSKMKKRQKHKRSRRTESRASRKKKKILLWISVAVFVIALAFFIFTIMRFWPYWFGLERTAELYTYVNVTSDRGGFDLNATALTFGLIKVGGAARRNVTYENHYDFPIGVEISSEGSINELLEYETPVIIEKGGIKSIGFEVRSGRNTTLGYYDGIIRFKIVPAE